MNIGIKILMTGMVGVLFFGGLQMRTEESINVNYYAAKTVRLMVQISFVLATVGALIAIWIS